MIRRKMAAPYYLVLGATFATLVPLLGGCAESAIAAAGVTAGFGIAQGQAETFIRGELKAARLVALEDGVAATLAAMEELQLEIRTLRRGEYDTYVRGKAAVGPEFKVLLEAKSPVVTKFEIRIGWAGDQSVSRLLMSRIDHHLGIPPLFVPVEESPFVAPVKSAPPRPPAESADDPDEGGSQ